MAVEEYNGKVGETEKKNMLKQLEEIKNQLPELQATVHRATRSVINCMYMITKTDDYEAIEKTVLQVHFDLNQIMENLPAEFDTSECI